MSDTVTVLRNGVLTDVPADSVFTPGPTVPQVPTSVSPAQAKLALLAAGKYDQALAAVASFGPEAEIYWTSAQEFKRNHPLILGIGAVLNLSETEIDELFLVAQTL